MKARQLASAYHSSAVRHRRWMHQHPELSMEEAGTTAYILRELDRIGIPYITPHTTGAIGIIKGKRPGKTIGFRADIDALPITEENDIPHCSQNAGVMHACGHDFHTASLLVAGEILWQMRDTLEGTVKLIFQPSEEGVESGALAMMAKGDLDDCDAFAAIHVNNTIPTGTISVEPGPRMAASSGLYLTLEGTGGHGGSPWETADPITAAAAVIMNLQPMLTRELDRHHIVVVSVGTLHGGTMKNIIPEEVHMEGTIRFYEPKMEDKIRGSITRIVEHICAAYRTRAKLRVTPPFPAVINDQELALLGQGTAAAVWGEQQLVHVPASTTSDDFAFYGSRAPLLYAVVGTANQEKHGGFPLHHPHFDVDEDAMENAAAFFAKLAVDFLGS